MSRFDVIELRQLADQTALTPECRTVAVPADQLHELLDAWEDIVLVENELEAAKARISELESELDTTRAGDVY